MGTCTLCGSSANPTVDHEIISVYKKTAIIGGGANYTKYRTTFSDMESHLYPVCDHCQAEVEAAMRRGKRRIPLFAIGMTVLVFLFLALVALGIMNQDNEQGSSTSEQPYTEQRRVMDAEGNIEIQRTYTDAEGNVTVEYLYLYPEEEATERLMIWGTLLCTIPLFLPMFWFIGYALLFVRARDKITRLLRSRAVQDRLAALGEQERRALRRRQLLSGWMEAYIAYTPEGFDAVAKNRNRMPL